MANLDGTYCGLHYDRESCSCNWHCTGCKNAYGPRKEDCCTCCHSLIPTETEED